MRGALEKAGFTDIHIDTDINPQWMVFRARKTLAETQPSAPEAATLAALSEQSRAIAGYWQRMASQVEAFAAQIPAGEPVAIYGAGFYGSFIWQYWPQRERILCFVDRNPHVQERGHKGIPAVAAKDLPAQVQHILVGINPPAAKAAMAALDEWSSRSLQYHYLF